MQEISLIISRISLMKLKISLFMSRIRLRKLIISLIMQKICLKNLKISLMLSKIKGIREWHKKLKISRQDMKIQSSHQTYRFFKSLRIRIKSPQFRTILLKQKHTNKKVKHQTTIIKQPIFHMERYISTIKINKIEQETYKNSPICWIRGKEKQGL